MHRMDTVLRRALPLLFALLLAVVMTGLMAPTAHAQAPSGTAVAATLSAPAGAVAAPAAPQEAGGEANLKIPDLSVVNFLGMPGHTLLMYGLIICALGFVFGLVTLFCLLWAAWDPRKQGLHDKLADTYVIKL